MNAATASFEAIAVRALRNAPAFAHRLKECERASLLEEKAGRRDRSHQHALRVVLHRMFRTGTRRLPRPQAARCGLRPARQSRMGDDRRGNRWRRSPRRSLPGASDPQAAHDLCAMPMPKTCRSQTAISTMSSASMRWTTPPISAARCTRCAVSESRVDAFC